ncbi:MAG: prepilin-type N-terminal cleavage/methylation domain-containing protein [Acidobacteriota bacterium]|nr:prepilin-type N-terminal cleavage/methylation domain-containing protein [Acidobacteriota bacterium]
MMVQRKGFTLIELLIGSAIMLVVVIGALTVYSRSNKISVDQNQYAELQHDVRSAMYLMMRDIRMVGAGLPVEFNMYGLEGWDNESQGATVQPDRLRIMGNMEDPLHIVIQSYSGGVGGGAANAELIDFSLEQYPYPDEYYVFKTALILPNPASGCREGAIRTITHVTHSATGGNEKMNFSPGLAPGINPPGGLVSDGGCAAADWTGGVIVFVNVLEYWLDVTGSMAGLTAGVNGYLGIPDVLYVTKNAVHFPLAQNVENFQLQYNGDLDEDGQLDGFRDWDANWTLDDVGRIRQIRAWILGRTPNPFIGLGGQPPNDIHHYRRPLIANSPAAIDDDNHRRFLLESTANIRNMSLNLYNRGER